MAATRSNQNGIMSINLFGAIQSRAYRMAELVSGKKGATRLSERIASMNIKPKEKNNE